MMAFSNNLSDNRIYSKYCKKINEYLRDLPSSTLGVERKDSIEILDLTPGAYNLNFKTQINGKKFIFRINIEQQSGLINQIEYEYRIHKFLENHTIAPKAYHFDNSKSFFDLDIMIEEYIDGPYLSFDKEDVVEAAKLLSKLHSLKVDNEDFIVWKDPLAETYNLAANDLHTYKTKRTADSKIIMSSEKLLEKVNRYLNHHRSKFKPDSLNHTDVVCDNYIKSPKGLKLIDWEKPRIDDYTYDLCVFLSEPAQLWCSNEVLTTDKRKFFIQAYARATGKESDRIENLIKIREPLISLHWVLWGAIQLSDLKEGQSSSELLQSHEDKIHRYERLSRIENIENILDSLS